MSENVIGDNVAGAPCSVHASRFTHHDSRITFHASRFTLANSHWRRCNVLLECLAAHPGGGGLGWGIDIHCGRGGAVRVDARSRGAPANPERLGPALSMD